MTPRQEEHVACAVRPWKVRTDFAALCGEKRNTRSEQDLIYRVLKKVRERTLSHLLRKHPL